MSLKTIKVNPIFLAADNAGFSAKNKTRKEKPSGISLGQSNNIKKKLIARIKNFQQNSQANGANGAGANVSMSESIQTDVFSDSVQFLDNLARDKEEKKREKKNTTLKKKQPPNPEAYMNIATELPPELNWNTILPSAMPNAYVPNAMPTTFAPTTSAPTLSTPMLAAPTTSVPSAVQWQAAPQPSYSNLKTGGTRPTYRTWLRTTQKQKPVVKPTINILEDIAPINTPLIEPIHTHAISMPEALPVPAPTTFVPTALNAPTALMPTAIVPTALSETTAFAPTAFAPTALVPPYTPSLKPRRKRITKTLKYKLGKHANGKVSVLIKNSQTRRKVQTEQALLKQKSILDIKNHLRSNNLLKVGSNAPSDVLRHLYEQSILAGQVENKAKDTLIHNFFNEEKK
jgi:hypothetical protein